MIVLFLVTMVAAVHCGRPTLSDPLGLYEEDSDYFNMQAQHEEYAFGQVWPKPQQEARQPNWYSLNPQQFTFDISTSLEQSYVLNQTVDRYRWLTFPDVTKPDSTLPQIKSLQIRVNEAYKPMNLNTDESYTLTVGAPTSSLTANTVWGAIRGMETFSQVVYQNESGSFFAQQNKIADWPRFNHRGFLIDTSRHYVAVTVIYKFLDAMAFSKFNVFHWHIVDDQSFPFVSQAFPSLHLKGAYNNKTHIYTPKDVKDIIEYARLRGIRVLPEFDTPGHTQSWFSIENLLTPCYSGGKPNGNYGPIDPTSESSYVFLEKFFAEIGQVFPDDYIHMGGDEVSFACWQSNPNIAKWMKEHNMTDNYSLLEQYYEQRLLDIIGQLNKGYVIWQEVVDNKVKVKPDTVVNVWKGGWQDEMSRITKLGYATILSSPWYLNYINYGIDWTTYYKADPQAFPGTQEQLNLVIGGTACMWGEFVDGTNVISRTWARGLSVGERLWSAKHVTDIADATKRIWEHRCRYLRRGIQAENVVQSKYCRHEWFNTHRN